MRLIAPTYVIRPGISTPSTGEMSEIGEGLSDRDAGGRPCDYDYNEVKKPPATRSPELIVTQTGNERIHERIASLYDDLLKNPVYSRIEGIDAIRCFMEYHVFVVWDFMSLLKELQRRLCCVDVPWMPPADPSACRLVNQIVLGEESDLEDSPLGWDRKADRGFDRAVGLAAP